MQDNITLEYLLSSRNIENEIYNVDIKRYFGWDLTLKRRKELKKIFNKISKNKVIREEIKRLEVGDDSDEIL